MRSCMGVLVVVEVVVVLSLNRSVGCLRPMISEAESSNYDPIRKTLLISMEKEMGGEAERLSFVGNFEKGEVELVEGEPYKKYCDYEPKRASLMKGEGEFCVELEVYEAVAEGDHQEIYWSMRRNGIYHSWDNENWDKKLDWGNCSF